MKKKWFITNLSFISKVIITFCLFTIIFSCSSIEREYYQIKIYKLENSEQEKRMDNYLKDAFIPALQRAGIENIGVFKQIEEKDSVNKMIYVFVPFKSLDQFAQIDEILNSDKIYLEHGKDYINASYDNSPYLRIESILLRSFESMTKHGIPQHNTLSSERIYELRSYQGATEKLFEKKVEMFNSGGESKIFIDLGFQPIFFGEVISGPIMPNLMYLTTFKNKISHEEHWDAFRDSPEWLNLKSDEQYDNTVSKNDKFYLYPTDYSEL